MPGDAIDQHMSSKQVDECDPLREILDDVPYNIFCMKEPDYTMKLMATYGGLVPSIQRKEKARRAFKEGDETKRVKFDYMVLFANHFNFCHPLTTTATCATSYHRWRRRG